MSIGFRKLIALIVGLILALGIVVAILVEDNNIRVMVALLGVLYVIYVLNLSKRIKEVDHSKDGADSPLRKR